MPEGLSAWLNAAHQTSGRAFDHVLVIMFENQYRAYVLSNSRWLERLFARLRSPRPRSHLPPRTLVVVTFDESDFDADYQPALALPYDGPNHVYTVLLGDGIEPGGFEEEGYDHYSLLRPSRSTSGSITCIGMMPAPTSFSSSGASGSNGTHHK